MTAFEQKPYMAGKEFPGLAQRMAYALLGTFPDFIAVQSDLADEGSQRQLYDFLWHAAALIYEEPGVLGLPDLPDDSYGFLEVNNRKPELIKAMRSILKKIDGFYELLMKLGEAGEAVGGGLRVPKAALKLQANKQTAVLKKFGFSVEDAGDVLLFSCEGYEAMVPAWVALSHAVCSRRFPVAAFARCMFDPSLPYGTGVFAFLSGNAALFQALEEWQAANGYIRKDVISETGSRIEWSKPLTKKDDIGLNIWFDYRKLYPVIFELKIPRFREVLQRYGGMDVRLQGLILERTKPCDGCGYCVQTDREKRKHLTFMAEHNGRTHRICPFFPYLNWHCLDENALLAIKGMLWVSEGALRDGATQ